MRLKQRRKNNLKKWVSCFQRWKDARNIEKVIVICVSKALSSLSFSESGLVVLFHPSSRRKKKFGKAKAVISRSSSSVNKKKKN